MKSSLAIALLASAAAAEQELSVARGLEQAYHHYDQASHYNYAPQDHRSEPMRRGREERHATYLPEGYGRDPRSYQYEEEHPYQYHPSFANESQENPAKSPGKQSPGKKPQSPKRGSPPKGSPPKGKKQSPPKGKKQSPPKQQRQSPPKQKQQSPPKQKRQSPPKQKRQSPPKQDRRQQDQREQKQERQQDQRQRQDDKKEAKYERQADQRQRQDDKKEAKYERQSDQRQRQDDKREAKTERKQDQYKRQDDKREAKYERQSDQRQRQDDKREAKYERQSDQRQKQDDKREAKQERQQDQRQVKQDRQQDRRPEQQPEVQKAPSKVQYQGQSKYQPAPQRPTPQAKEQTYSPQPQQPQQQQPQRPAQQQPQYYQPQQPQYAPSQPSQPSQQPVQQAQPPTGQHPHTPQAPHQTYTPGADVTPVQEGYRGYRAPFSPYQGPSWNLRPDYPYRQPQTGYPSMTGYRRYPDLFHSTQMTMPYSRPGYRSPVNRDLESEITGYDTFGRPVYKPISPYDDKKQASGQPAQLQRRDYGQRQAPMTQQPQQVSQEPKEKQRSQQQQPQTQSQQPQRQQQRQEQPKTQPTEGKLASFQQQPDQQPEQAHQAHQTGLDLQPQTPRTLGLIPGYGEAVDPYSEIGFPQIYNPYLAKKAQKAWYKQQKYLAKYGQFGQYDQYGNPFAAQAPMQGQYGMYQNGIPVNSFDEEFDMPMDDEDNMLGLIHPQTEGARPEDRPEIKEPEYVQEAGREFAILDWGLDIGKPASSSRDDERVDEDDEEDARDVYEEKAPKMKYSGEEDYDDWRQRKEEQEQRDREEKERIEKDRAQKEIEERERRDKTRAEQERDEQEETTKKQKKSKKDKKKGKKGKHDKPVRHEAFGDFEDHFNYDLDEKEDEHKRSTQHSKRRHYETSRDEDEDHYGYLNGSENGLRRHQAPHAKQNYSKPSMDLTGHDDAYLNLKHDRHQEHYYEDHHSSEYAHEALEWPVTGHHSRDRATHYTEEHHKELDWPETHHDADYYATIDQHHPSEGDFGEWKDHHDSEKWYDQEHEAALKHRESQLYGTHYEPHGDQQHLQWRIDEQGELHKDAYKNKHYQRYYQPEHSKMVWPEEQEHETLGFHEEFSHELIRDHDIHQYHDDDSDFDSDQEEDEWYTKYEDPHFHAPLREHHDLHNIESEKRPTDKDFYEFDWQTIHEAPLTETHLRPMSEHGAIKKHEEIPHKTEKKVAHPVKTQEHPKATSAKPVAKPAAKPVAKQDAKATPAPKKAAQKSNDEYDYYTERHHRDSRRHAYESSDDEDEFPVYPYEASIYYDARNGYDIYYDPHYEASFNTAKYDNLYEDSDVHGYEHFNAAEKKKKSTKKQYGAPLRRSAKRSPFEPRQRRNDMLDNETPMYVRPYLEDPIFLQPDDQEETLLHPHTDDHHEGQDHHKTTAAVDEKKQHHEAKLHDLPGDPDLENPSDDEESDDYEQGWIAEHRNNAERSADLKANQIQNPNGFRKQGEKCNHNFECISNSCISFLGKAPACMPHI